MLTAMALAVAWVAAPSAQAASKSWACTVSYWDFEDCWSPFGLPGPADDAYVGVVGGINTVLRFDDFTDARTVRQLLVEAPASGPTLTFGQSGGSLTTSSTFMGGVGQVLYKQSGGTHTTTELRLGYSTDHDAKYQLQGGVLNATSGRIGYAGSRSTVFEQSGGKHVASQLRIGDLYRLAGGELQAGYTTIGSSGTFEHDAGTFIAGALWVGFDIEGAGHYDMSQGTGGIDANVIVVSEDGTFHQAGSTAVRTVSLSVGYQSSNGTYRQDGGTLQTADVTVAGSGASTLTQSAGTHTVSERLKIFGMGRYVLSGGALNMGGAARTFNDGVFEFTGGSFAGTLENRGQLVIGAVGGPELTFNGHVLNQGSMVLNASAWFTDGLRNDVDLDLLPTGRTLTVVGRGFENNGVFTMRGGTLQGVGSAPLSNHNHLSGHGRIDGYEIYNFGEVVQTGGTLALASAGVVVNYGRWSMEAQRDLKLDGSGVIFNNGGALALNGGRVTGSGQLVNVGVISGSGQILSGFRNRGTLGILHGEQVTLTSGFQNAGLIDLRGSGASLMLTSGQMSNDGLLAGNGRVFAAIDNRAGGRIQAEGGVLSFSQPIHNAGLMVAEAGGTLLLQLPLASQTGTLQLNGGTIDTAGGSLRNDGIVTGHGTLRGSVIDNAGRMQFGAGNTQVFGSVNHLAGAQIVVSGTGVAHFHGTVQARAGSEIRVSADSAAVFFGAVSQASGAAFTGDGTRYFEGGLSVGDSPGSGGAEGSVVFGSANVYRAEIGGLAAGSGFDHFTVGDRLSLGGTLQLSWWGGFEAQAGQRFDLFDWGSVSGSFAAIDLAAAALEPGLRWDTSRLLLDGSVAVTAVPEPGAWALMLAGLAGLARARRRRAGRSVLVAGLALAGFQAQAALHDRGSLSGVALVYDDVLNLTWLKDANWFSDWGAGISTDGQATFAQAKDALSSFYLRPDGLDLYRWRLPGFKPVNGVAIDLSFSHDGSTDFGYNIGAPGSAHPGTTVNEMAHLFHSTLGNKAYCDVAGQCPQAGYGLVNQGPFVNFPAFLDVYGPYWVELAGVTTPPGTAEAFRYNLDSGAQDFVQTEDFRGYIWAVYDGDVTAVPEPAPAAMLLAGLVALWWRRRRPSASPTRGTLTID